MGIMPHTDIEAALELSLSLDIPFWPQLPRLSIHQDMYAQAAQNFPGIRLDPENKRLDFSTAKFEREVQDYFQKMDSPETFTMTGEYAAVYNKFMERDIDSYHAIRGQIPGPISLGFRVLDEEKKPIIYNDNVRTLLFDFIRRKVNIQYRQLREKNPNAFVWLDEPGLYYVFNGLYGYSDIQAKEEYHFLLDGMEGSKGLHLCPNVNLPFLLGLGMKVLSFDAYQLGGTMPREYAKAVAEFLRGGGIISWGIVPTEGESQSKENPGTLAARLIGYWEAVEQEGGLPAAQVAGQALIAPAKCCIQDLWQAEHGADCSEGGEERSVEKAFDYLGEISRTLRDRYNLSEINVRRAKCQDVTAIQ